MSVERFEFHLGRPFLLDAVDEPFRERFGSVRDRRPAKVEAEVFCSKADRANDPAPGSFLKSIQDQYAVRCWVIQNSRAHVSSHSSAFHERS